MCAIPRAQFDTRQSTRHTRIFFAVVEYLVVTEWIIIPLLRFKVDHFLQHLREDISLLVFEILFYANQFSPLRNDMARSCTDVVSAR